MQNICHICGGIFESHISYYSDGIIKNLEMDGIPLTAGLLILAIVINAGPVMCPI